MSDIEVLEREGWSGIAAALKRAQAGDRVLIGPGRYEGEEALNVPSGVTLSGSVKAELEFTGTAVPVTIENASNVMIEGLRLTAWRGMSDLGHGEIGGPMILIKSVDQCIVQGSVLQSRAKRGPAILARLSSNVSLFENDVSGALSGIVFASSDGSIQSNRAWRCKQGGICVQRDQGKMDIPSNALISSNHCHDNDDGGIWLFSSESEAIEGNECWNNGFHGIGLVGEVCGRTSFAKTICANICYSNKRNGIGIFSSNCNTIKSNKCMNNYENGIVLDRVEGGDLALAGTIRSNFCSGNKWEGIALVSSNCEITEENECWNNGNTGICLHQATGTEPALASTIRANRCHDNQGAGILLASSISNVLDNNECWNNISGIVLQRQLNGDAAQAQAIRNNRCHDNLGAGIVLSSSYSDVIENNSCWSNEGGIALRRSDGREEAAFAKTIRTNNCHSNQAAGISIESANSESIIENAIWNNKGCGVDIKNKQKIGSPSNAALQSNLIAGNQGSAIHFSDSIGSAIGNRFKDNGRNDVRVDKPQFELNLPNPVLEANTCDETLDLSALFLPALRNALADMKLPSPNAKLFSDEGLASFLASGSSGSFRTFWTGMYHAPEPLLNTDGPPENRFWRLVPPSEADAGALTRLTVQPAAGLSGTLVSRAARKAEGRANWSALVINDLDADDIREKLGDRANFDQVGYVAEGERIAALVTVDVANGDAPLREKLSGALMDGKSWRRERLALLAKVEFWPLVILLSAAMGLWLSPLSGWVAAQFAGWGTWEWLTAGSVTIAGLLASLSVVDLFLPRHLRTRTVGSGAVAKEGFKQVAGGAIVQLFDFVTKLVPEAKRVTWADRADLRWQQRYLFGNADIATLYLSGVTQWREGDLAWLRLMSQSLTDQQKLNVMIELDGRLSLRPLLVEVDDCPWQDGIELYLFDDVDKLRLGEPPAVPDKPGIVDVSLIGAADEAAEVREALRNDVWCPVDLLPTLPLASAPTRRLRLQEARLRDAGQLSRSPLVTSVYPAAKELFTDDPVPWSLDAGSFWQPFELAKRARALHTPQEPKNPIRDSARLMAGRTGYRGEVAAMLRGIWAKNEDDERQNLLDWHEYVASALRFGIWHSVNEVTEVLKSPLSRDSALKVRRTLEAVQFLGQDLRRVMAAQPPIHGEEDVFIPAWDAMRSAMIELKDGYDAPAVIGSWLGAEEACFGSLPPDADRWLEDVQAWVVDPLACNDATATTAGDAFSIAAARQVLELRQLDPRSRDHALERAKATTWRGYPERLSSRYCELASGIGANRKSLAMLFADAQNVETIKKLIIIHRRNPIRTVYALANATTNHIIADHLGSTELLTFDDRMPLVARTLAQFRDEWIKRHGLGAAQLSLEFAQGASGAAVHAPVIYDYFIAEGAASRIIELVTPDTVSILEDLEGKFELELVD